jgi:hypothetical protein
VSSGQSLQLADHIERLLALEADATDLGATAALERQANAPVGGLATAVAAFAFPASEHSARQEAYDDRNEYAEDVNVRLCDASTLARRSSAISIGTLKSAKNAAAKYVPPAL